MAPKTSTKNKTRIREIVDQQLVKALAHPLRAQILAILNERVASPNELSQELGEGLSQVSYHVKVLRDYECIELVKTEPRRGAVEHYYRGMKRSFLNDVNWEGLSPSAKEGISVAGVRMIMSEAIGALGAGTFDARDDSHLSCTPVIVDEKGWSELSSVLATALEQILEIQAKSAGRLAEAQTNGIPATVAILGFESPSAEKADPAEKS
ncbi:MAG TPA: helix-turn-helix domain-containing protein [Solirubrobacterales bacterium]